MAKELQAWDWVAVKDVAEIVPIEIYHEYVDPMRIGIDSVTLCGRTLDVATRRANVDELQRCAVCSKKLAKATGATR